MNALVINHAYHLHGLSCVILNLGDLGGCAHLLLCICFPNSMGLFKIHLVIAASWFLALCAFSFLAHWLYIYNMFMVPLSSMNC